MGIDVWLRRPVGGPTNAIHLDAAVWMAAAAGGGGERRTAAGGGGGGGGGGRGGEPTKQHKGERGR